jgi:hypothetical protein
MEEQQPFGLKPERDLFLDRLPRCSALSGIRRMRIASSKGCSTAVSVATLKTSHTRCEVALFVHGKLSSM